MSPMDQIDSTSLHERTKSREIEDGKSEEVEQIEQKVIPDVELDQMEDEEGNEKRDGVDHDVGGNETLLPRLSRISVSLLPEASESY